MALQKVDDQADFLSYTWQSFYQYFDLYKTRLCVTKAPAWHSQSNNPKKLKKIINAYIPNVTSQGGATLIQTKWLKLFSKIHHRRDQNEGSLL